MLYPDNVNPKLTYKTRSPLKINYLCALNLMIEKMNVIENASIICHSRGEKDVYTVKNENTGIIVSLENEAGLDLELGMEGSVVYNGNLLVSFEPTMVNELV